MCFIVLQHAWEVLRNEFVMFIALLSMCAMWNDRRFYSKCETSAFSWMVGVVVLLIAIYYASHTFIDVDWKHFAHHNIQKPPKVNRMQHHKAWASGKKVGLYWTWLKAAEFLRTCLASLLDIECDLESVSGNWVMPVSQKWNSLEISSGIEVTALVTVEVRAVKGSERVGFNVI